MAVQFTVNILLHNDAACLESCLASLESQTFKAFRVIVSSNGLEGKDPKRVRGLVADFNARYVSFERNLGYTGGHNRIIQAYPAPFYLLLNQDVCLEPEVLSHVYAVFSAQDNVGIISPKILRASSLENKKDVSIDAAGMFLNRYLKNYERGSEEKNLALYMKREKVLAGLGACVCFRDSMLQDILEQTGEMLDESYFAYREEVDLAIRAHWLGWKALYLPEAQVYHLHRYQKGNRKHQPRFSRRLQFRNRYFLLIKNIPLRTLVRHLPFVMAYEAAAFVYVLLFERFLLKAYGEVIRSFPELLKKRRRLMGHRRQKSKALDRMLFE